jgi:unsaturated rhamnogalacturonyl hydrolase
MKAYLSTFAYGLLAVHACSTLAVSLPGQQRGTPLGVTREGKSIEAFVAESADYGSNKIRVLFITGFSDAPATALMPKTGVEGELSISTITLQRKSPDGAKLESMRLPPNGTFYNSPTEAEAQYLWRWIGMHAPDLVVEVVAGDEVSFEFPRSSALRIKSVTDLLPNLSVLPYEDHPLTALNIKSACDVGVIPTMRIVAKDAESLTTLKKAIAEGKLSPSPARLEMQKRLARTPDEIAAQLLAVYGKRLDAVQYIPALAVVGRLREGRILHGDKSPISPIALAAVEPYLSGKKPALPQKTGGSGFAGHLLFGELAEMTGDKRYVELVKAVADLAFDADGKPREAMPSHSEMSDAVFMGCPVLAQAGKLTGDEKYFDACLRNLRFMQKLCLRKDGLYRHSPLDEAAWGRGNGFPGLGLAWSLSEIPETYNGREEILSSFRAHMTEMLRHQDAAGCWHQVVDHPESYREFTVTAMTTYAMARGVRMGWLDLEKFAPAIERGWYAIRTRIGSDGGLVDVCTGTGKQKSLRDYYDRPAILGRDERGGAMALMVTTEMQMYFKWLAAQK